MSFQKFGASALTFLTCDNINKVTEFSHKTETTASLCSRSLYILGWRRMTSIVDSPRFVTTKISSRSSKDSSKCNFDSVGYDGTKSDVWLADVILYAMLFRSLPLVRIFFCVIAINLSISGMTNLGKVRMLVNQSNHRYSCYLNDIQMYQRLIQFNINHPFIRKITIF